ncbi:astacin-like metalloprotease toxin 5 [Argiope bruennichi]|uniref:Metalloendopeptidase n=1 Tax=Argiope bruennichi TaxID=94029 RepID=A0A8T0E5U9_ARGBR|nr:astacin-like metalloprotease toxin 5 [Argiope bruennichi]KAF8765231.1 Astacin-like metalloprotease toxin 1 [Argiope bruennichi]
MRFLIAFLLGVSAASALIDRNEQSRVALQNPDLFQGDILGFDPDERNVIPHLQMRWSNKKVPYIIDRSLASNTALIQAAMNDYHINTCIRFVPRTTERNYIKLFSGQGCYSYVGMINRGEQPVSLGPGCLYKGTIVHELGHAIGFFHEQNRSDRDNYLVIYWNNISKGMESQFALLAPNQNLLLTPFDHDSIMLYGNYAFSKDRTSLTMVAKNGKRLLEPYDKAGLTQSDIQRVRKMYNC